MGFCHLNLGSLEKDSVGVKVRGQKEKEKEAEENKRDGPGLIREMGVCSGFLSSMKPDL